MVHTIEITLQTQGHTDILDIIDEIAPSNREYQHNSKWGDNNGLAHLRAALIGPSITVPVANRRLALGTWQQIIFLDFDTRPRQRTLVVQCIGE